MRDRNVYLYCAVIEPFVGTTGDGWNSHFCHHSLDWDYTVLRNITKSIKDIKRMCLTNRIGFPCHIRLQVFDDIMGSLRYIFKNSVEFTPSVAIFIGIITDGEFNTLGVIRDIPSTMDKSKLPEQVVQTRPKVIQEITSNDPQT